MIDKCPYPDESCPDSGENYAGESLISKEFQRELQELIVACDEFLTEFPLKEI